ncbi:MAG: FAD:protein FMN transferase [Phycisphaerales bacterium]
MPLTLAVYAMGTRFELVLDGASDPSLRAIGEEALREIMHWHQRLSAFERDSVVSQFNREAADRPVRVEPEILDLLTLCREVWEATGGAFDPAVGAAMQRLGFHPQDTSVTAPASPATFADILLDPAALTVRFTRPGLRLDLGAIAKGWALDRAADILRGHAVTSALLHGGTSSIIAIGSPSGQASWRVAIQGATGASLAVDLADAALGVSAPRGRTIEAGGHILDPRTGRPTAAATTAAVIAESAALADVWSTALVVLGARPVGGTMPAQMTSIIESDSAQWAVVGPSGSACRVTRRTQEAGAA